MRVLMKSSSHLERESIMFYVRWHLRSKLSLRDLVEIMAERNAKQCAESILLG